jgi:N-methylhydantoinase B/oxoprolinase/acetone carboxylase alpha subunit
MDPIRFEIIRQAIDSAAQEMCVALYKSAYSTNIKTRLDLSCAILDRQGRVIGQSAAMPCHISAMNVTVPESLKIYGPGNLEQGDQIATNIMSTWAARTPEASPPPVKSTRRG